MRSCRARSSGQVRTACPTANPRESRRLLAPGMGPGSCRGSRYRGLHCELMLSPGCKLVTPPKTCLATARCTALVGATGPAAACRRRASGLSSIWAVDRPCWTAIHGRRLSSRLRPLSCSLEHGQSRLVAASQQLAQVANENVQRQSHDQCDARDLEHRPHPSVRHDDASASPLANGAVLACHRLSRQPGVRQRAAPGVATPPSLPPRGQKCSTPARLVFAFPPIHDRECACPAPLTKNSATSPLSQRTAGFFAAILARNTHRIVDIPSST